MWKFLIGLIIDKVIEAVKEAVSDYFKLKKKKEEDAQAVDQAIKIKDPAARARAIRNLLR